METTDTASSTDSSHNSSNATLFARVSHDNRTAVLFQLWINATQKFQLNSFVSENVDTFEQLFVMVSCYYIVHQGVAVSMNLHVHVYNYGLDEFFFTISSWTIHNTHIHCTLYVCACLHYVTMGN